MKYNATPCRVISTCKACREKNIMSNSIFLEAEKIGAILDLLHKIEGVRCQLTDSEDSGGSLAGRVY